MGLPFVPGDALDPLLATIGDRLEALHTVRGGFEERVAELAGQLAEGEITIGEWEILMRDEVRNLHLNALILSHGGDVGSISYADWGLAGYYIRQQYGYLRGYGQAIQLRDALALAALAVPYTQKYLSYRSKLYSGAAVATFYQSLAMGMLPQVPRDGQTRCKMNCKCELRFEPGDTHGTVNVYWDLRPAEHCEDCIELNKAWNPYVLQLPVGLSDADYQDFLALANWSFAMHEDE